MDIVGITSIRMLAQEVQRTANTYTTDSTWLMLLGEMEGISHRVEKNQLCTETNLPLRPIMDKIMKDMTQMYNSRKSPRQFANAIQAKRQKNGELWPKYETVEEK